MFLGKECYLTILLQEWYVEIPHDSMQAWSCHLTCMEPRQA